MILPRQLLYCKNLISFMLNILFSIKKVDFLVSKAKLIEVLKLNQKYIYFTSKGRIGLFHICKYLVERIPNKKEVVMSSFTIFDLVNMVICSGAKPVFIDHEKDSFDMNTKNLVSYIEKNHNKIASILLCHYSLNSRNLIKIKDKCSEFEIPIIQDMAISLVSRINGESISNFSDFSFFSFNLFKFLPIVHGGAVCSNNKEFYRYIKTQEKEWPKQNFKNLVKYFLKGIFFKLATNKYFFNLITFRLFKFADINNIKFIQKFTKNDPNPVLRRDLPNFYKLKFNEYQFPSFISKLSEIFEERRIREKNYIYYLSNIINKNIKIFNPSDKEIHSFINFPILVSSKKRFSNYLYKNNIDHSLYFYRNCNDLEIFKEFKIDCQNTDLFEKKILFLPIHHKITQTYQDKVIDIINKYDEKN